MKIVTKILEKNPEVTSFECYAIAREAGELVQVGEVTADLDGNAFGKEQSDARRSEM